MDTNLVQMDALYIHARKRPCDEGQVTFTDYFCGHGYNRRQFQKTYPCVIAPNDVYCPHY